MEDDLRNKLRDYALKLLSLRPRSVNEIKSRLNYYCQKKKLPLKLTAEVINELSIKNLLNDEEFAKWWIDQRHEFNLKGKKAITQELTMKGISREIIGKLLEVEKKTNTEFDLALKVILKKYPGMKNLSKLQKKMKISSLLYRRGFDWEVISQVIDYVTQKE